MVGAAWCCFPRGVTVIRSGVVSTELAEPRSAAVPGIVTVSATVGSMLVGAWVVFTKIRRVTVVGVSVVSAAGANFRFAAVVRVVAVSLAVRPMLVCAWITRVMVVIAVRAAVSVPNAPLVTVAMSPAHDESTALLVVLISELIRSDKNLIVVTSLRRSMVRGSRASFASNDRASHGRSFGCRFLDHLHDVGLETIALRSAEALAVIVAVRRVARVAVQDMAARVVGPAGVRERVAQATVVVPRPGRGRYGSGSLRFVGVPGAKHHVDAGSSTEGGSLPPRSETGRLKFSPHPYST